MDRDEILSNFQAITGEEDFDVCLFFLNSAGWNLEVAVSQFFDANESSTSADIPGNAHDNRGTSAMETQSTSSTSTSGAAVAATTTTSGASKGSTGARGSGDVTRTRGSDSRLWNIVSWVAQSIGWVFSYIPFGSRLLHWVRVGLGLGNHGVAGHGGGLSAAASRFSADFNSRYGVQFPFVPVDFMGALAQCAETNALLLVYLHAAVHERTDPFCRTVLCNEQVIHELTNPANNYLCWGGDVSQPEGQRVARLVRAVTHPYLVILKPSGADGTNIAVCAVLEGSVAAAMAPSSLAQQLASLARASQTAPAHPLAPGRAAAPRTPPPDQQLARQRQEDENRRRAAQLLRDEQERAYQASVEADRRRADDQRAADEARLEAQRDQESKRHRLPDEPAADHPDVCSVVIRLPDGDRLNRRFAVSDTLQSVFDFVDLNAFGDQPPAPPPEYSLATNFPRQEFSRNSPEEMKSLKSLGLSPKSMFFVELK